MKMLILSTTYLDKIDIKREDIMKVEESFPISEQGFVIGKVLEWRGLSDFVGHGCEQILYVKILLFEV